MNKTIAVIKAYEKGFNQLVKIARFYFLLPKNLLWEFMVAFSSEI